MEKNKRINKNYWKYAKIGADRRGLEWKITLKYAWSVFVKQKGRCKLSGVKLTFGFDGNASLDRIDSSKGYIKGNIQWVDKTVNKMKTNLKDAEVIYWSKIITKFNK